MITVGQARRRGRRFLRHHRPLLLLLAALVVASLGWVAVRGALAVHHLKQADETIDQVKSRVENGDAVPQSSLVRVQRQTAAASRDTHDVVWKLWSHAPLVGDSFTLLSGISQAGNDLSANALPALAVSARSLRGLRRADGQIDVQPLTADHPALAAADSNIRGVYSQLLRLPGSPLPQINRAESRLVAQVATLQSSTHALAIASAVAPDLLGSSASRTYLVVLQNNAEARASGGIVGSYGLLRAVHGRLTLLRFGSDNELVDTPRDTIDFGAEWRQRYEAMGQSRDWREVTSTPDFPTAARAMLALWTATHQGQVLDGVLSLDAPAMADLLAATGPVDSPLGRLTAQTFVPETLSDIYRQFPDKDERSALQAASAKIVVSSVLGGSVPLVSLAQHLAGAIDGHHLQLYSTTPATQAALVTARIGGALPTAGPVIGVYTQDANADKLSYYLRREVRYQGTVPDQAQDFGDGRGPQRQQIGTLTIRLTNTAPDTGLTDYVAPATDLATGRAIQPGTTHVSISVYTGAHGIATAATVDGNTSDFASQTDHGLSVFTLDVWIAPGVTKTVQLQLAQPDDTSSHLGALQQPVLASDDFSVHIAR